MGFYKITDPFPFVYTINSDEENDCIYLTNNLGFLLTYEETKKIIKGLQSFLNLVDDNYIKQHNKQILDKYHTSEEKEEKPKKKPPQIGYIYFISDDKNRIKIGKSKQLKQRLGEYTKLAFEPKLIHYFKTNNYHEIETFIHEHFKDKHIRGEWFKLTKEDIEFIKSGKLEEMINNEYF